MSTPTLQSFSAGRAKSYVYKLPLFTRLVVFILVATWAAGVVLGSKWDIQAWGALVPDEVGLTSCECFRPQESPDQREMGLRRELDVYAHNARADSHGQYIGPTRTR